MGRWVVVGALGVLALSQLRCELNESCDPSTDPECGYTPPPSEGPSQFKPYVYIIVRDQSPLGPELKGIAVDAIDLSQSGALLAYAGQVHNCVPGAGAPSLTSCNDALGPPDGCELPYGWVSLGGEGGALVVSLSGLHEIFQGDVITVHECSGRSYSVGVGVAPLGTSATFVTCNSSAVGTSSCTVPALPQVPR